MHRSDQARRRERRAGVHRQGKPVPPRRLKAFDPEAGQRVQPNPNSAVVWHIAAAAKRRPTPRRAIFLDHAPLAGEREHSGGTVGGGRFPGLVHCLDAASGKVYWTYDMKTELWATRCWPTAKCIWARPTAMRRGRIRLEQTAEVAGQKRRWATPCIPLPPWSTMCSTLPRGRTWWRSRRSMGRGNKGRRSSAGIVAAIAHSSRRAGPVRGKCRWRRAI